LLENKQIQIIDNKIHTTDVSDIQKQSEFYQKMQRIEKARQSSSIAWNEPGAIVPQNIRVGKYPRGRSVFRR
jgi:hypothetical protein